MLWHDGMMLSKRLIDSLYVEAMLLADEVRCYFDDPGHEIREQLSPMDRVLFSCESLKVTTRLMHVIAWILTQRAVELGELTASGARDASRRLGNAVDTDAPTLERLPVDARHFVTASCDLYRRVVRLDAGLEEVVPAASPAKQLHDRLQQYF